MDVFTGKNSLNQIYLMFLSRQIGRYMKRLCYRWREFAKYGYSQKDVKYVNSLKKQQR